MTPSGARIWMDGRDDVYHRVDLRLLLLLRSPPHGESRLRIRRVREAHLSLSISLVCMLSCTEYQYLTIFFDVRSIYLVLPR